MAHIYQSIDRNFTNNFYTEKFFFLLLEIPITLLSSDENFMEVFYVSCFFNV